MRSRPNQQQLKQQEDGRYDNAGIITENPISSKLQINEIMMDVVIVGMEGGCHENITMIQDGVTKWGKLRHDGHKEEDTYKNSDLREKNCWKKQQKEDKQKIHEKEQQI